TAFVELNGQEEMVHVKNTGRCKELLLEGARVFLEEAGKEGRKTKYSLIAVYKGEVLVNMDSQAPNQMAAEALAEGKIEEIGEVEFLKREVKYENSRFDLYYQKDGKKGFIEVKGVTLEENGVAKFPDAPTERGAKHLRELIKAKQEGYEAAVLFVIQMKGVKEFRPNEERDTAFTADLREASEAGVKILAYDCHVDVGKVWMENQIPVIL
ncbi:MAG: DNA/RNA nuclease SfsA, partial [Anaerotignum sp.]|nr:DNA/RNA nuclease SfsA [Anaerotignum sp.]